MENPHIVILGAGYGGMMTTIHLQRILKKSEATITLVDQYEHHYQSNWLHENAAGTLELERTRTPIRNLINDQKVTFIQDKVLSINREEKNIVLEKQTIYYDVLVIGLGNQKEPTEIKGLNDYSFSLTDINRVRLLREHIEYNFAKYNNDKEKNQARINIVVVGGDYTGIEFLGELADRIPELSKEYDVEKAGIRIINLEAKSNVLIGLDSRLIAYAVNSLESRGVEFITDAQLIECRKDRIIYEKNGKEEMIPTMTTIWTGGKQANSIVENSGFPMNNGKAVVKKDLRAVNDDHVFFVGDCALIKHPLSETPLATNAQIAFQEAKTVARNIKKFIRGNEKLQTFKPKPFGTITSLGEDDAIGVILGDRKLFGWKAVFMKKMMDNCFLLRIGGMNLLFKKGKFNIF